MVFRPIRTETEMPQGDPWAGFDQVAPKADPWGGFDKLAPTAPAEPPSVQRDPTGSSFEPIFQTTPGGPSGQPTPQAAPPSGQGFPDFALQGLEDVVRGAEIQGGRMAKFGGQEYARLRNALAPGEQTRAELGRNVQRAGKLGEAITAQGQSHPEPTTFPGKVLEGAGGVSAIGAGGPAGLVLQTGAAVEDRYNAVLKETGSEPEAYQAAIAEIPVQALYMLPIARVFMGGSEGATLGRKVLGAIRDGAIGPGAARVVGTVIGDQITKQEKADFGAALKEGLGQAARETPQNAAIFGLLAGISGVEPAQTDTNAPKPPTEGVPETPAGGVRPQPSTSEPGAAGGTEALKVTLPRPAPAAPTEQAATETLPDLPPEAKRVVYHGSPYVFDKFDVQKIGSGEGAQVFGHGLYFAGEPAVAEQYRKTTSDKTFIEKVKDAYGEEDTPADAEAALQSSKNLAPPEKSLLAALKKDDYLGFDYPHQAVSAVLRNKDYATRWDVSPAVVDAVNALGKTYEVSLAPHEDELLDWDKPLSEQSGKVKAALQEIAPTLASAEKRVAWERNNPGQKYQSALSDALQPFEQHTSGEALYNLVKMESGSAESASKALADAGVKGVRYLDQQSRGTSGGELISIENGADGWKARIRVKNRGGAGFMDPTDIFTTSKPYATEADARAWAQKQIGTGSHNYVIFNDKDVEIIKPGEDANTPPAPIEAPLPPEPPSSPAGGVRPSDVTVAEMPKGRVIGKDILGNPLYSKLERGPLERPKVEGPKQTQIGAFDEAGGLFEKQAEARDQGFPWESKTKEIPHEATGGIRPLTRAEEADPLSRKDVRDSVLGLANQARTAEMPGQGRIPRGGAEGFAQKGRTQGANEAEWWDRRPSGNKLSPAEIQNAARKVWKNPKAMLGPAQREIIDFLTSEAVREIPTREQAKEAKASLASKKALQLLESEPGSRGAANILGPKGPPAKNVREEGGGLDLTDKYLAARQLREQTIDKNAVVYGQDLRAATASRAEAKLAETAFDFYVARKIKGDVVYDSFEGGMPANERASYEYAKTAPEAVRKVWDQAIADKAALGAEAQARIPDFAPRENYAMQAWKPLEEGQPTGTARPKFGLSTPREEARTFPTVLEGLAAGRERAMPEMLANYARSGKQISLAIENRALVDSLKKSGVAGNTSRPGWQRVEASKLFDSAEYQTPEGEAVKVSLPLFAEPKTAEALNSIIAESKLKGIGPLQTAKKINNGYRASIFYTGMFHPRQFIVREILSTPGVFKNPIKTYHDGLEAIRQWDPMTQLLVGPGGLRLFNPQDFTPVLDGEKGRISKALEKIPGSDAAKAAVEAMGVGVRRFTFERLGAAYKLMGARAELAAWATRNAKWLRRGDVTMEDGARAVGSAYGDLFGGQNWERILLDEKGLTSKLASPTMRDVTGLMLNTPDWTVSKLRLFVKAFERGEGANIRARMWGRTISRAAAATVAANFLMSLFDDQDLAGRYKEAWSRGWLKVADIDWTPLHDAVFGEDPDNPDARHYFGVVGALADPVSWLFQHDKEGEHFDPIKGTLKHMRYRESFIAKLADNAALAEDSLGRAFTGAGEMTGLEDRGTFKSKGPGHVRGEEKPSLAGEFNSYKSKFQDKAGPIGYEQMPSYVLGEAMGAMPVQIQAAYAKMLGQLDWSSFVGRSLGFDLSSPKAPEEKRAPPLRLKGGPSHAPPKR